MYPAVRRVLAGLVAPLLLLGGPAAVRADSAEERMVREINDLRAGRELPRLQVSTSLTRAAERHAEQAMSHDEFEHSDLDPGEKFSELGEVMELHDGRSPRVKSTLENWKDSRDHARLLLDPDFRWVGAGRATGRYDEERSTVWVVQLGAQ